MKKFLVFMSVITTICVVFFSSITLAYAQVDIDEIDASLFDNTLSLQASPLFPQPKQPVTVTVNSSAMDLVRSTITWYVNGTVVKKGLGVTSIQVSTGAEGSSKVVVAEVENAAGKRAIKSIQITSASVDVVWEAHSYTPPFYKGKALYPYQGTFTAVAITNLVENGVRLNPKDLIYTWEVDGELLKKSSGLGKDSAMLSGSIIIQPLRISVEVSSPSGKTTSRGGTTIEPRAPETVLYEESPLYGPLYHKSFGSSITLKNQEIWLKAVPYYFSTPRSNPAQLTYAWTINNSISSDTRDTVILRQPGKVSGNSTVSVSTSNNIRTMQYSSKSTRVFFAP